jgi:hypothetical protein
MNALWQSPWVDTASSGLLVTYQQEQTTTNIPSGCTVQIQYRTANKTDFSDATAWSNTSFNLSGRFIQSQAVLTRDFSAITSPSVSNISVTPDVVGQDIVTNLLAAGVSQGAGGASQAGGGVVNIILDSVFGWESGNSFKVTTDGTAINQGIALTSYVTSVTGTFTASAYIKGSAGANIALYCRVTYTDNSVADAITNTVLDGTWQRLIATNSFAIGSGKAVQYYQVMIRTVSTQQATTFWVDGIQLEKRAYASPWVLGGTTAPRPKSVMIEEGTTNLIQNGSIETNTVWWSTNNSGATVTMNRITNDGVIGSSCIEYAVTNPGSWHYLVNQFYGYGTITSGAVYTLSFWARKTTPVTPNAFVAIMDTSATNKVLSEQYFTLTNKWQKFVFTFTAPSSGNLPTLYFSYGGGSPTNVGTIRVDGVQLEQKAYATSYTDYGVVRSPDSLTIPTSGVVNPSKGTVIIKAYVDGDIASNSPAVNHYLFSTSTSASGLIGIKKGQGVSVWEAVLFNNSGVSQGAQSSGNVSVGWHTFAIRWNSSENSLWIDGVKVGTKTNPSLPTSLTSSAFIGSWGSIFYYNNLIEDVNIFFEDLTDSEMVVYTAASSYVPLTEKHSYKLGFENNLVHGEGGYRIGNVYDLTQLGTIASSYIASTQSVPASSNVVIETTTDNGTTWYPITQSGAIVNLTSGVAGSGKIFKVRQKFTTTNPASIPSVADYTVKIGQTTSGTTGYIKPLFNKLVVTPTGITKWQLENKKYPTSFVTGTRQTEQLTVPTSGVLHSDGGVILFKAYLDANLASATTLPRNYTLFNHLQTTTNWFWLAKTTGNQWGVRMRDGSGNTSQINVTANTTVGWHYVAVRWSSTELSLWLDGSKIGFVNNPYLITTLQSTFNIGSYQNGAENWNNLIDSVDIFGESLTDAEMAAYTTSGTILTEKHTYKLDFNSQNLTYQGTGVYNTGWLDAGINCNNSPWVKLEKQDVVPSGSSITYYFAASNTNVGTPSVWQTDITKVVGRYIWIKIVMTSQDPSTIIPKVQFIEPIPQFA